tara:strand:- start:5637 stop:6926 length:1290 start_codon:yes stop_codon:yes gene_type:complete
MGFVARLNKTMVNVRLLLHSGDATYDASKKTYTFDLDKSIGRVVRVKVQKAHYSNSTSTAHPLMVYVHSDAICDLMNKKHTLQLKSENHDHRTNIIATLSETHTVGRYDLQKDVRSFRTDPNRHVTTIDVSFSNNGSLLEKTPSANGNGGGGGGAVTDATIEAMSNLIAWFDLHPSRTLAANFSQAPLAAGELFHYLYNRAPGPSALILDGNYDFERYAFGTNGAIGFSRDSDPNSGHGQYLRDGTYPTFTFISQAFHFHQIIKTGSSFTSTSGICQIGSNVLSVLLKSSGAVGVVPASGPMFSLSNISWVPNRVYVLSVWRKDHNGTPNFFWRWEDLTSGTAPVTEQTVAGATYADGSTGHFTLGYQGHYYRHIGGPAFMINGTVQSEYDNCITYLKQWYGAQAEAEEDQSASVEAEWFLELDMVTEN